MILSAEHVYTNIMLNKFHYLCVNLCLKQQLCINRLHNPVVKFAFKQLLCKKHFTNPIGFQQLLCKKLHNLVGKVHTLAYTEYCNETVFFYSSSLGNIYYHLFWSVLENTIHQQ